MKRFFLALTLLVGVWSGSAEAAPIFLDHFDSEHGGTGALNYGNFANWDVIGPGTVDLIPLAANDDPNGPYDFLGDAGMTQGLYVDLDGSSAQPGLLRLKKSIDLTAGTYVLSFLLTGNFRNWSPDQVDVNIFSPTTLYASSVINRNSGDVDIFQMPFTLTAADTIKFSFKNNGADYRGALLDDVALNPDGVNVNVAPVPEPGSLMLLGTGMLLVGRKLRQRRRSN